VLWRSAVLRITGMLWPSNHYDATWMEGFATATTSL
jgi:hypothetical protein